MKKILCVISRPPYQASHVLELIEAAMVGAVFDFTVSVLFRDEGVWALVSDQDATVSGRRTVGKILGALQTYEIDSLYVCEDSLRVAGLENSAMVLAPQTVSYAAQSVLFAQQDAILGAQS